MRCVQYIVPVIVVFGLIAGCESQHRATNETQEELSVQEPEEAFTDTVKPRAADVPIERDSGGSTEIQASKSTGPLTYEVLKGPWYPYDAATGLGLEILIPESATQDGIVELLRQLGMGKDPVAITVWTSRVAYENAERNIYGDPYDRHLICTYVKNTAVRRAFFGFNEIRWVQVKGRFSHLCGQTTPMQ